MNYSNETTNKEFPSRIREIDLFRGFCILLMVIDHFMFFVIKFDVFYWTQSNQTFLAPLVALCRYFYGGDGHLIRAIIRYIVLGLFMTISGISCSFSKNNLKRFVRLAIVALSITLAMFLLSLATDYDFNIFFGVFHCYGVCVFAYWLINKFPFKIYLISALSLVVISVLIAIFQPTLPGTNILMPLGIPSANYVSSVEYFPVFPAIGVFVIGTILGKTIYKNKKSLMPILDKIKYHPIEFVGRHGILIYACHIPLLALCVWLLGVIAFGKI